MFASPTVDRVMADQRAAAFKTRSIKTSAKLAGLRLAMSMVDLTTLEGKDSPEKVRALCRKAVQPGTPASSRPDASGAEATDSDSVSIPPVAAVCVYPNLVRIAREALESEAARTGVPRTVRVASVATGFPSGQYPLKVKLADAAWAIDEGADEIDMVINRGQFLAGRYMDVAEEIREVQRLCVDRGAHLKVILETGELETYDNVRRASDLAIASMCDPDGDCHGAFIKTSTGKVSPAATMPVTLIMLEAIRDHYLRTGHMVGMKPAGGIRTAKEALHYLVMVKETLGDRWLTPEWFRFGASSLANDILRQINRLTTGVYTAAHDLSEA